MSTEKSAKIGFHLRAVSTHLTDRFNSVVWSPDGKTLLTASNDKTARIWEAATGKLLCCLEGHTKWVQSVDWSPDGKYVVSGADDQSIRIWDAATGVLLRSLNGHTDSVRSVGWSRGYIASGARDGTVRIWDAATGEVLRILNGHTDSVQTVSWSRDGEYLASGADDNAITIWNAATGKLLRSLNGHTRSVRSVDWSPDGKYLASGARDHTVGIWDVASGNLLHSLRIDRQSSWVRSVSWSPDSTTLASAVDDHTIRIWNAVTGRLLRSLKGHTDWVRSVDWSPDGNTLASGADDHTVRIWDVASGNLRNTIKGQTTYVMSVAWSPDGKILASGADDNTIRIWDAVTGDLLRRLLGHTACVRSVGWSPDGRTLASGADDNTVRIWDTSTGDLLRTLEVHTAPVRSVGWSPDGRTLASGADDNTVRIWDTSTGRLLRSLNGHTDSVQTVSWSPDGKCLASGADDNTVRIWDAATGEPTRNLEMHTASVLNVAWSPDGRTLASGSHDTTVKIWDVVTGSLLRSLEGHTSSVRSVGWSPDGKALASASHDRTVKIWDAATGRYLGVRSVTKPTHHLLEVAFRATVSLSASYGTTALGDPDLLVAVDSGRALEALPGETSQVICAKIVLVGESKAGKSYLAHRIVTGEAPREGTINSTHGMKLWSMDAAHLCAETGAPSDQRRDIVLWDMGGQEEYRLVHQLFVNDAAVVLLLFDTTRGATALKEVETWNKYLAKQLRKGTVKLLVGTKRDQPSGTIDRIALEQLRADGCFASWHETSAVTGEGMEGLCKAVAEAIDWDGLAKISRPELFQKVRDEIEARRKRGDVVLDVEDLHRSLSDQPTTEENRQAVRVVMEHLATQGVVARSRVSTGEHVLVLQIQEIERHACSLILAARNNPRGVPAIEIRAILQPDFALPGIARHERLPRPQGVAVLECAVNLLVDHGICFQHEGLLVFPTLFATAPGTEPRSTPRPHGVSLCPDFAGAIDNIYASLVAWLVLAQDFGRLRLWKDQAEFEVKDAGLCGLRKVALPDGFANVEVYFEAATPKRLREEFIGFVEEHLTKSGVDLFERLAVNCPRSFAFDDETLRRRIAQGARDVMCPRCEIRHRLIAGGAEVRKRDPKIEDRILEIEERRKNFPWNVWPAPVPLADNDALRPIRLLHLSDLHFNADTRVQARLGCLLDDLGQTNRGLGFTDLDYLVVSGDFTDKGCLEGFDKAYDFLSGLTTKFKLSADRCIFVPGNHDLAEPIDAYTRCRDSKGHQHGECIERCGIILARDPEKYPLRFKAFSDKLYHNFLQRAYPMAPAQQGMAISFWETGIQFLTLNSCWEIDEFDRKNAGIHSEAVRSAVTQAQQQAEKACEDGQLDPKKVTLRIAVWHHAVTAPDYKMKDLQFLGILQNNGVRVALHGDVHEMRQGVIRSQHSGVTAIDPKEDLHIAASGSFGARAVERPEAVPRLYNVLEIERDLSSITVVSAA